MSSSSSQCSPAQPAMQPQEVQSQLQPQAQVPQARPSFPEPLKSSGLPSQAFMNMTANMNPALYEHLAAQARGQNAKVGVMEQQAHVPAQQLYYIMQAQAQAQARAQGQGQGQIQATPAQLQAHYAAQMAQIQAAQAQQQQQNVQQP